MKQFAANTAEDFHDGAFKGIFIADKKTVHLFVRDVRNQTYTVTLGGVEKLKMWDVFEGSIILGLELQETHRLTERDIEEVYGPFDDDRRDKLIPKLLLAAKQGHMKLFQMSASYGAQCVALCATVEISEGISGL